MELKEFIKETLAQIIDGIKEAQEANAGKGAKIHPNELYELRTDVLKYKNHGDEKARGYVTVIDFEIGLTDKTSDEKTGGLGVSFASIAIGGSKKKAEGAESVTSIKFEIPVILPFSK